MEAEPRIKTEERNMDMDMEKMNRIIEKKDGERNRR